VKLTGQVLEGRPQPMNRGGESPEWLLPVLGTSGLLLLGVMCLSALPWVPLPGQYRGPSRPTDILMLLLLYSLMASTAWMLSAVAARRSRWGWCLLIVETPFVVALPWVWIEVLNGLTGLG
jgi:hypothetical protein